MALSRRRSMAENELLERLRELEVELHQESTRRDASRMAKLLHPEFEEVGRSGRRYSRAEILGEFVEGDEELPEVVSRDLDLARLADHLALLTYVSAHRSPTGELYRHTLRSSLWILTTDGWQMRFHQGTPTDGFPRTAVDHGSRLPAIGVGAREDDASKENR